MYSNLELDELSESIRGKMTEKRFRHTQGVEEEIVRMGKIYLPDQISELRAAALLHDLAKELPIEKQVDICRENDDPELKTAIRSPAVLHGHAAAYLIPKNYPKYNLPEIISAIYKHTTGSEDMSVFDKLLFLADYIEPNRQWQHCRDLRERFWRTMPDEPLNRSTHLDRYVLTVLDFTLRYLTDRGITPDPTTEKAAASLRKKYPESTANEI